MLERVHSLVDEEGSIGVGVSIHILFFTCQVSFSM